MSETATFFCDGGHEAHAIPEYLASITHYGGAPLHRWPPKGWVTITVDDANAGVSARKLLLCPDCATAAGAAIYPPRTGTDDWGHPIEVPAGTLGKGYGE
jgi:hypothetical protein